MPGRDFKNTRSALSIALAISDIGLFIALRAALGPTPETVINLSKNSLSTSLIKPIRIGKLFEGSLI